MSIVNPNFVKYSIMLDKMTGFRQNFSAMTTITQQICCSALIAIFALFVSSSNAQCTDPDPYAIFMGGGTDEQAGCDSNCEAGDTQDCGYEAPSFDVPFPFAEPTGTC